MARVLIVTGGMLVADGASVWSLMARNAASVKASTGAWFDIHTKIVYIRHHLAMAMRKKSRAFRSAAYRQVVDAYFDQRPEASIPELTEVILCTLLAEEGIEFSVTTYNELYTDKAARQRLLASHEVVFASTTLLRDLSELIPMMEMLSTPSNKVVAGGALAGILHTDWPGCAGLDVLAIGYGEYMVKPLADWIRSGFTELIPPSTGRTEERANTLLLWSGVPEGKDLDHLPTPDWNISRKVHSHPLEVVRYESVRGCPYRCSFCNYPYLFDDKKFRYRSADRIYEDWKGMAADGARWVTCLDSLFTVPPKRLTALCKRLIAEPIDLTWSCYARVDDLAKLDLCQMMYDAGCRQVQIGLESGSQLILDNMNKQCKVAQAHAAFENCRNVGLTTATTVIVGFPGETKATVDETIAFLRSTPPDFVYAAPLNTRIEHVPMLSAENRERFGLHSIGGATSSAPYWRHDTMGCTEVADHVVRIHDVLMRDRVALEGSLFHSGMLGFTSDMRDPLLDFQYDLYTGHPWLSKSVGMLERWAFSHFVRDVDKAFSVR